MSLTATLTLLQTVLSLLMLVQSNPALPQANRDAITTIAQQAITTATQTLSQSSLTHQISGNDVPPTQGGNGSHQISGNDVPPTQVGGGGGQISGNDVPPTQQQTCPPPQPATACNGTWVKISIGAPISCNISWECQAVSSTGNTSGTVQGTASTPSTPSY